MQHITKLLSALLLFCLTAATVQAQETEVYTSSGRSVKQSERIRKEKEKKFDASKIIFGGELGLGFGSITYIAVNPILGYRITDNFAAGISLGYGYTSVRDFYRFDTEYYPYRASHYSGGVWTRYVIWNNIFVHAEYEHNFMAFREYRRQWNEAQRRNTVVSENVLYNAPSLLLGGGYRAPITDRVSLVLMGLYDVLQAEYSPYRDRIDLRIGVNVGF
jgi:hypothetical protein